MSIVSLRIVVLGGPKCGKTSLILNHGSESDAGEDIPLLCDPFDYNKMIDNVPVATRLLDTRPGLDGRPLRQDHYGTARAALLLFSVDSLESVRYLREEAYPELIHERAGIPIFLMATKMDLREDSQTLSSMNTTLGRGPLTSEEGSNLASEFNAVEYFETSARDIEGLTRTMLLLIRSGLATTTETKSKDKCIVM